MRSGWVAVGRVAAALAISRTLQASMKRSFLLLRCRAEEGLKGGDGDAKVEGSASQPRDAVSHQGELTLLALVIRGHKTVIVAWDRDGRIGTPRQTCSQVTASHFRRWGAGQIQRRGKPTPAQRTGLVFVRPAPAPASPARSRT